ncbi:NUDIX domain-containing protein [Candidatus Roizmanbacteria bacterium]|jgi:8-oxo-dGTP pyrophosphatase MutT (NUDIX family)|nr:NUDIX domain-containing protein [Candidatus Roizmanbacteria bacterium]
MKVKNETSAGGIVYKKDKKILWLISQHSAHKGWVFPKGLIGDKIGNESMEQAALREVREETGVTAKIVNNQPIKTQYRYRFQDYLVDKTVYYFLMEYVSGNIKNHDWEMSDVKFVSQDEVKKTLTYKSDQEAFKKILSLIK